MNRPGSTIRIEKFTAANQALRLKGFFEWGESAPSEDSIRSILLNSYLSLVAIEEESGLVVGLVNCISDGIASACLPFLEVLSSHRERGIGRNLVLTMLSHLSQIYMVDVTCDDDVVPFYEKLGLTRTNALIRRNYEALQKLR